MSAQVAEFEPETKLYDLLTKGSLEQIQKDIGKMIQEIGFYCNKVIGEGAFGKVSIPLVPPIISVRIGTEYVPLKIVVKESKNPNANFFVDIIQTSDKSKKNSKLILNGDLSLTTEALILFMLSTHWYRGMNIHMPYMIGFGACDKHKTYIVTSILTERQGLESYVQLDRSDRPGNLPDMLFRPLDKTSNMATVGDLIIYCHLHHDEELNCVLPNDQKIYVPELIDSLVIFILHTFDYLWNHFKMTMTDQHLGNIFVHWLNSGSRCGTHKIGKTKHICYEIAKDKFIKVKTNGIIFKIGDTGTCIMNPQKDVFIVGDLPIAENMHIVPKFANRMRMYLFPILSILGECSRKIASKTKIYKLFDTNEYFAKYDRSCGFTEKDDKNCPTELEVLNMDIYKDLVEKSCVSSEETFVNKLHYKS